MYVNSKCKEMVKLHGKVIIDTAYECSALGHIWLFNKKLEKGFARINEPEWGYISAETIKYYNRNVPLSLQAVPVFTQILPCSFKELIEEKAPQIQTYFQENL